MNNKYLHKFSVNEVKRWDRVVIVKKDTGILVKARYIAPYKTSNRLCYLVSIGGKEYIATTINHIDKRPRYIRLRDCFTSTY